MKRLTRPAVTEKQRATRLIMGISTFVYTACIVAGSLLHHETGGRAVVLGCLILLYLGALVLGRYHFPAAVHLYLLSLLFTVIFFDFCSCTQREISSMLYIIPVILSLFLTESPVCYAFTSLFTLAYIIRTVFFSHLSRVEDIFLLALTGTCIVSVIILRNWLFRLRSYKMESLKKIHSASIKILARVSEIKDEETANHLNRVENMMDLLCRSLRKEKAYRKYITDKYLEDIKSAAYLHDIGKIGISDKILKKEGSLTGEEFEEVKKHTDIGYNILKDAKDEIDGESIYDMAMEIAHYHHEKWDGSGYPEQLKGFEIPFSARLMAIVDVYDALISRRPYKEPFSHEKALSIIREGSGKHFDPMIVKHFLAISDSVNRMNKIA